MSTNDPPQGPYGPGAWGQDGPNDPAASPPGGPSGSTGPSWPPQQPQPSGGWSEQPTTQWSAQQPGGWPDQATTIGPQGPYGPPPGPPYGPPPYGGPPGGPPYHPSPPPPGTSGGSNATLWIVGGVVSLVLVLVVAVAAVLAVRSGGDPDPSPTTIGGRKVAAAKTKVLWQLPEPPGSDIKGANQLSGLWLSDESVVRATVLGLTAYDIETGKQQWSRPMPSGTALCQITPEVVDGVGAVIYGAVLDSGAKCDQLMAVDAKSGEQRWTSGLKHPGDRVTNFSDSFTSVSIASGSVIAQNSDAIRAYSISSGARKWGLIPKQSSDSTCRPIASRAEGDRAILVLDCLSGRGSVASVDAATGKVGWTHLMAATEGDALFVTPISVKPLVLASRSIGGRSQMIVLDERTGSVKQQISSSIGGSSALDFSSAGSRTIGRVYYHVAIKDGKLFAATEGASGARRNEIVAIDLSTGEPSWTTPAADDTRERIIKVDDDGVLTLNRGGFDRLPRLVRYDPKTGKGKNGATLPDDVRTKLYSVQVFTQGDKVLLVSLRSEPDQPPITVLGE